MLLKEQNSKFQIKINSARNLVLDARTTNDPGTQRTAVGWTLHCEAQQRWLKDEDQSFLLFIKCSLLGSSKGGFFSREEECLQWNYEYPRQYCKKTRLMWSRMCQSNQEMIISGKNRKPALKSLPLHSTTMKLGYHLRYSTSLFLPLLILITSSAVSKVRPRRLFCAYMVLSQDPALSWFQTCSCTPVLCARDKRSQGP